MSSLDRRGSFVLTVADLAKVLGRDPRTVVRWIRAGYLPADKCGRTWTLRSDVFRRWIDEHGRVMRARGKCYFKPFNMMPGIKRDPLQLDAAGGSRTSEYGRQFDGRNSVSHAANTPEATTVVRHTTNGGGKTKCIRKIPNGNKPRKFRQPTAVKQTRQNDMTSRSAESLEHQQQPHETQRVTPDLFLTMVGVALVVIRALFAMTLQQTPPEDVTSALRLLGAVGAGLATYGLPGVLVLKGRLGSIQVRAAGALAVLIIVYYFG